LLFVSKICNTNMIYLFEKSISLKLQEHILTETEALLDHLKTSRNKYFNEAIEFYNQFQRKKMIEAQLISESKLISEDSMKVLGEFEMLEDEM